MYFQQSPIFGIGMDNYRQFSSHVAHNSFIHSFTELGLIGGTLFLGAFYYSVRGLFQLRKPPPESDEVDPELRRLHPFMMGMTIAYTIGICFLSRGYIVPTYMILGLAVVYLRLHATQTTIALPAWTFLAWSRLVGVSGGFLIASYTFVRMFVNWR